MHSRMTLVAAVPISTRLSRFMFLSGLIVVFASLSVTPSLAQGDPAATLSQYGLPHMFGLPTATTARQFGMGGMTAAVQDVGFANPAFAGALSQSNAGLRYSITDFDLGLKLKGAQGWVNTPLNDGQGIQVVGTWLGSDRGPIQIPGAAGIAMVDYYEGAISLHYGRRLSDQWLVGVGVSPLLSSYSKMYDPISGTLVTRLGSSVNAGARVGVLYQFAPEGFIGAYADRYGEDVTMAAPGLPAVLTDEYSATQYAIGISGRASDRALVALEWGELKNKSGPFENVASGWHAGVEFDLNSRARLRAGVDDNEITTGFGFKSDTWTVSYAYIKDWNDELVGALFGGSETQQIEFTGSW